MIDESAAAERRPFALTTSKYISPANRARAGGDWCEVLELSEDSVALVLGDVAGHGEPVAAKMERVRACVLQAIRKDGVPSAVLAAGNEVVCTWGDDTLVTAIVAVVDRARCTLTFANAGHPAPLLVGPREHAFLYHSPADLPLGVFGHHQAADYVITLPVDALLILYTDGITEHARDPLCGESELLEAARFVYVRPGLDAARTLAQRILSRARGRDDAAAIVLRTTAGDDW
jgi:serine phosphatase RsbU (regulator of sigma subunit)